MAAGAAVTTLWGSLAALWLALLLLRAGLALRRVRVTVAAPVYQRPDKSGPTESALGGFALARRLLPGSAAPPQVDILVAILSGDPALPATLEHQARTLSSAHLHWLVDDDDAIAQTLCAQLAGQHPQTRIRILRCPPAPAGHNPKLHKLTLAQAELCGDVVLVLDDDTRLSTAALTELIAAVPTHGASTGLPQYRACPGLGSSLLAQFVNISSALTYLPLLHLAPAPTLNGMGYALRRESLLGIGGFAPLLEHLTDDLAVARALIADGGRIEQTRAALEVTTSVDGLRHYSRMMHRWFLFALLLMRSQSLGMRLLVGAVHGLPALLWLALWVLAWPAGALAALLGICAVRAVVLLAVQRLIQQRWLYRPLLSELAELLQPLHLLHATLDRRIVWRRRRYRVHAADRFEAI